MKISICSRSDIESLIKKNKIPKNSAIVSFADTPDDFIEFPKGCDVLSVAFYDIRPYTTVKEHYDKVLPEARKIAEYIIAKKNEDKDIICQCDYGQSRSAGLAAAILEKWGHQGITVFADYRYTPNQFVFNKVLAELNKLN